MVIFSQVIDLNSTMFISSHQDEKKPSLETLQNLDLLAERIGEMITGTSLTIVAGSKNLAFLISYTTPNDLLISSTESKNDTLGLSITHTHSTNKRNSNSTSFQTGKNTFENNDAVIIYSFLFKNDALFKTQVKKKVSNINIFLVAFFKNIENLTLQRNF